jgi:small subunit ribosomal protein S21
VATDLAEVKLQDGESIESALRRFKRKVQQEDIIKDMKKHSYYLKPGDKRRAKQALARKRTRKKQRRDLEWRHARRGEAGGRPSPKTPQMLDAIRLFVLRFAVFCPSEEGV